MNQIIGRMKLLLGTTGSSNVKMYHSITITGFSASVVSLLSVVQLCYRAEVSSLTEDATYTHQLQNQQPSHQLTL